MSAAREIADIILGAEPNAVRLSIENVTGADFRQAAFLALDRRGVQVVEVDAGRTVARYDATGLRTPVPADNVSPLHPRTA